MNSKKLALLFTLVFASFAWGDPSMRGQKTFWDFTDISGTPGAGAVNTVTGRAAFAAAASSVSITSNKVTTASVIMVNIETVDTTCFIQRVTPGNGSFVVTCNAAATATTKFSFVIFN